jgi:pimeloyl-ACP methyl ester carboxylesterase
MPVNALAPETDKPTIVLVHGAFVDSSSWNRVVYQLQDAGLPVLAIANPLRSLDRDAAYLRSVIDHIDGPVVVVGHSYGGTVMSEATEGAANVRALVFIASFTLEPGESTGELAGMFPGSGLSAALTRVPGGAGTDGGDDLYIEPGMFRAVYAADAPEATAALMAATQRPIASAALKDKATKAGWKTIPSWTMVALDDVALPAEAMRFMAARAKSHTVEIEASHAVTVSRPGTVADLILAAVRETNRV